MPREPSPKLLVLGSSGQVGRELARLLAPLGTVNALDRSQLDLTDFDGLRSAVRATHPNVIVNAAAYTNVDGAENKSDIAHRVNGAAPGVLAEEAARLGALLVHYSTDYVFDGSAERPYREDDATRPLNAYGASKLDGDLRILDSAAQAYIFRIGWVYARRGQNFPATIQRLARERDELRVVADQYGAPTWSRAVAEATVAAVDQWLTARRASTAAPPRGVYHMASPDFTTWHEFASTIVAGMRVSTGSTRVRVTAITTADYPTAALRPRWTVLDSSRLRDRFGIQLPRWRDQYAKCFESPD